jgi:hypothetical protein
MPLHIERVFPRDDIDFVALVDIAAVDAQTTDELELRLRKTHPEATVRARDLTGEHPEIWYVYRDGSWFASRSD